MSTLNNVVLFVLVLFVLSVGSVACGDSDSPTAPSTTMADAPPSFGPSTPVRTTPASFDADNLRPDARGWNAYDFNASWDGRMLRLVLVEDRMRDMREASKPHRNRLITVGTCPVEPHHSLQACGDPIWQGSMRLAGRLELDPIPLASCEGWIVVNAAELYDDKYDGWRNAPCPTVDDDTVSSDGTGSGWPEYPPLPPRPQPMVDSSLPVTVSDPTGDLDWINWVPSYDPNYDGGSRLSTDVTSVSLSDQDANGWIRVTFTLASAFDLTAIATAATADVAANATEVSAGAGISFWPPGPVARFWHSFAIRLAERSTCPDNCPVGVWIPSYGSPDDNVSVSGSQARSYVRAVPGSVTGSTFSFEINPPAALRGAPGFTRDHPTEYTPRLRFIVDIHGVDPGDTSTRTYSVRSADYVYLPKPFTLPNLP